MAQVLFFINTVMEMGTKLLRLIDQSQEMKKD
jgi:hypothetical protein